MVSDKISQLQLLQQNLQNLFLQKQQIQNQSLEIESALMELKSTDKAYKIIGNIMVSSPQDALLKELTGKKDLLDMRLKNVIKQEEKLKENYEQLQQEVVGGMKKQKE